MSNKLIYKKIHYDAFVGIRNSEKIPGKKKNYKTAMNIRVFMSELIRTCPAVRVGIAGTRSGRLTDQDILKKWLKRPRINAWHIELKQLKLF